MKLLHGLLSLLLCAGAGACAGPAATDDERAHDDAIATASDALSASLLDLERTPLSGDVVHYALTLQTPGAALPLRLHRVVRERGPGRPRPTTGAILLMHGDFATFASNFAAPSAPGGGLAVHLAQAGLDVWGFDRRWTALDAAADPAALAGMGFADALADARRALGFARLVRTLTGAGPGRLALGGFSRGAHLAYVYAAGEAARPPAQRHVDGVVAIDVYAALAPDDEELRLGACARRDDERAQLAAGSHGADNSFFALAGALATAAPDEPSPLLPGYSNLGALRDLVAQTYFFFPATPRDHLDGGAIVDGVAAALRWATDATVAAWLAAAPPWQALAEIADGDALWCGEGELPVAADLAAITVPVLYVGAAGGFGDHGLYTTAQLGSADVTTQVIRRLDPAEELEDVGHADLLLGSDAPALAWDPIATWIAAH